MKKKEKNANTIVVTRKIQIEPIGESKTNDFVHQYVDEAMTAQYRAKNLLTGQIGAMYYKYGKQMDYNDINRAVAYSHNPILADIDFPTGLDLKASILFTIGKDFFTAVKNGIWNGERTISNYKKKAPFYTKSRHIKLICDFREEDMENYKEDPTNPQYEQTLLQNMKVTLKWVNKKSFKVVLGCTLDIREMLFKIYTGEYGICDSKIQVLDNKNDRNKMKKIMLLLAVRMPIENYDLDENTVVGVDIGAKNPAVCALNNDKTARLYCGDNFAMLRVHEAHLAERKDNQVRAVFNKSQHGRRKKLRKLYINDTTERSKTKNINHEISKQVVAFALEHHAKYINLEELTGYFDLPENADKRKLWSYYEIQMMIKYKASMYGIEVRMVDSKYTSQICSFCGSDQEGQLIDRDTFICKNPECESHGIEGAYIESDFNAARNIAKSTNWAKTKKKKAKEKDKEESEKEEGETN